MAVRYPAKAKCQREIVAGHETPLQQMASEYISMALPAHTAGFKLQEQFTLHHECCLKNIR